MCGVHVYTLTYTSKWKRGAERLLHPSVADMNGLRAQPVFCFAEGGWIPLRKWTLQQERVVLCKSECVIFVQYVKFCHLLLCEMLYCICVSNVINLMAYR